MFARGFAPLTILVDNPLVTLGREIAVRGVTQKAEAYLCADNASLRHRL